MSDASAQNPPEQLLATPGSPELISPAQGLAPGAPGLPPTWSSSDKDFVTTALGGASRLWATGGHGMLNEVYWPSTGQPQIRDLTKLNRASPSLQGWGEGASKLKPCIRQDGAI